MSGVFLSYSRADRAFADQIIRGLVAVGVNVWWDEDMPGVDWQLELERKLGELAAVAVLWTPASVGSPSVRDEARLGLETDKLVNVLSGVEKPPFPFDRLNGMPLDGWTAREPDRRWTRLLETIEALIVRANGAKVGEIIEAQKRRDREFRLRQQALGRAREAYQDAQNRESEAAESIKTANAALDTATEQLQRVAEMRARNLIMHAAQEELNSVRGAKDEAELAHNAAKAQVLRAARALSKAKADMDEVFAEPSQPLLNPPAKTKSAPPLVADIPALPAADIRRDAPDQRPSASRSASRPATAKPLPPPDVEQPIPSEPELREPLRLHRPSAFPLRATGPWIALAAVAGVALVGAGLMFTHRGHAKASPSVSRTGPTPPVALPAPPPTTDPEIQAASALVGSWASQGLTCDDRQNVKLSVSHGVLYYAAAGAASPFKIEPSRERGVVRTRFGADEYSFRLDRHHALSMVGPNGAVTLTRCAG